MINVSRHLRKIMDRFRPRYPRVRIYTKSVIDAIDEKTGEIKWLEGLTVGRSIKIYLGSMIPGLKKIARNYGIELKEAHVRDDLIELLIHEHLHAAISMAGVPEATDAEEHIVSKIAIEAAEEVREMSKIPEDF